MIKLTAVSLLLGLMIVAPVSAHPPSKLSVHGQAGIAEEVTAFRKALLEAIKAKDAAKLRQFYAEDFTHTHTTAAQDGRDARIVALLAGDPVIETAPVEDLKIRVHAGGWVAIATGISPIIAQSDGKTYAVHWTTTYVRNEAGWQVAASHATRGREWKN
ncbi:MAG: nuclear transport factor 2 family protein [Beijerinckiaceae bacterium]|nr:nuclear transport factor 2 family protein [Beijerinckiaceae bacterium]MCZ8299920.1 nuclear transport factor 2 family protein [Beijerinckiaceae bacterium]